VKIAFFGTPAFAIPSLDAVLAAGEVVAVITRPDKPQGRGRRVEGPPVAKAATQYALEVLQPASLRDPAFVGRLRELAPDVAVVVAFGRLIPPEVLAIPPQGVVNLHPSLLPRYRGAAPIARAIAAGETETGVTVLYVSEEMDAGDIILQRPVAIRPDETAVALAVRLAEDGAALLVEALHLLEAGRAPRRPQDASQATWAPRLAREDGAIDWREPAARIVNLVRACDPWPGAFARRDGKELKIWRAMAEGDTATTKGDTATTKGDTATTEGDAATAEGGPPAERGAEAEGRAAGAGRGPEPGTVLSVPRGDADPLVVAAGEGRVFVYEVQPSSGRRMSAAAYVRGRPLAPGARLGGGAAGATR